ncbi:MAG: substrate-binding domain-containing protein [Chloroflexi bacterium]|nr:substrate-binding domain-containing protein [Chloroflexota bacterium]MCC6896565.1 substrate-binding domain-containing protein [Anaerolineae bacterium]
MYRKFLSIVLVVVLAVFSLGIASAQDKQSIVVGISNSFVSSEWRTQMIQQLEAVRDELNADESLNVEIELVIESEDTDAAGQEQQIQNLVNRGVDAIIVNPGDAEALRLSLEDAAAAGIVVISVDQEIDGEGVLNVVIDQTEWARISARWLAESLGGKGDIVLIEGFVGHPANTARMNGVEEVLAEYPDIKVVGRETGSWDQATGQQVMSDFLASLPNIDGVWTQDGMATGVLTAIETANPEKWPLVTGEARASFLQHWATILETHPDFQSIGVVNPPAIAANGLRIAVELLLGGEIDPDQLGGQYGNSIIVPIPYVVLGQEWTYTPAEGEPQDLPNNFEEIYTEVKDQPESYTLDGLIDQEQAKSYLLKAEG